MLGPGSAFAIQYGEDEDMKQAMLFTFTMSLALAGYGEPTFDGGSGAAASKSVEAMKASMTDAEQEQLDAAIQVVQTYVTYLMIQATLMGEREPAEARILWMALGERTASGIQGLADLVCHRMNHPDNLVTDVLCERMHEAALGAPQSD